HKTSSLATARKVSLDVSEPPPAPSGLDVDMVLFERALENMVVHAIKSAPPQTTVAVTFSARPDECQNGSSVPRLSIDVTNHSHHLPPEDLVRIFDRFAVMALKEQGKSHVGLGLAYCRMVV